jgi:hypothetical protein
MQSLYGSFGVMGYVDQRRSRTPVPARTPVNNASFARRSPRPRGWGMPARTGSFGIFGRRYARARGLGTYPDNPVPSSAQATVIRQQKVTAIMPLNWEDGTDGRYEPARKRVRNT